MNLHAFPYHSLMLLILTPFALLSDFFNIEALFKIPLLFADLAILFVLLKSFPFKKKEVYFYYFLNPIIIYSIFELVAKSVAEGLKPVPAGEELENQLVLTDGFVSAVNE